MSFSLDFTPLLTTVSHLVPALWQIFVIPLGFTFALGLIGWIYTKVEDSMKRV
jgi:hypothetical protein